MSGSDPSEKIREIDLTEVDFGAGLDLELRIEKTSVSPRKKAGSSDAEPVASSEAVRPASDSERTVVLAPDESASLPPGTRVDLALDLLAPTELISIPAALPKTEEAAPSTGIAETLSEESSPAAAPASEPVPALSGAPSAIDEDVAAPAATAAPAAAPDAWSDLDSWMERLDRRLAAFQRGDSGFVRKGELGFSGQDHQVRIDRQEELVLAEAAASDVDARDGIDQAVAFLEMDLPASARKALFRARGTDPGMAARVDALLSWIALMEGRPHESLRICEEWRLRDGLEEHELREFRYQSARALEALGRTPEARAEYRALLSFAGDYRDCAVRLHRLEAGAR